jgi:hypothetical protein
MIRQAFRWTNLALAFLLELCALGALGFWGVRTGDGLFAKVALGLTAPLLAAVLWGMFAAPRAPVSSPPLKLATQLAVFGSAALALYATGHGRLALVFALAVVLNGVLLRL